MVKYEDFLYALNKIICGFSAEWTDEQYMDRQMVMLHKKSNWI